MDGTAATAARNLVATTWQFTTANPALAAAAVLLAVVVISTVIARHTRPARRDPKRLFTASERAESFRRAGGRCEYTTVLLLRCRRDAEHADHLYPWSRGGATTLNNCVAACAKCNLSKSAQVLPRWRVRMIRRRRRWYYPAGVSTRVGERYRP